MSKMSTTGINAEDNIEFAPLKFQIGVKTKRRIIRIFVYFTISIITLSALNNQAIGDMFSAKMLYILAIFTFFTLFFLYKNWVKISLSYYFTILTFAVFYFDSHAGVDAGNYLYYFPLLFSIANLYNINKRIERYQLIVHILLIATLTTVNILTDYQLFQKNALDNNNQLNQIFKLNFTVTILAIGFFIYLVIRYKMRHNSMLENSLIEEKKLNDLQLEKTREKEILLAELQHRLKNNLSLMSSLLKLKMNDVDKDPAFALKEGIHAVQVVAHANHLQRFENNMILVPISPLFSDMKYFWTELFDDYPIEGDFSIQCVSEELSVRQAIPMSLILQELICEFWYESFKSKTVNQLSFTISKGKPYISIHIHSSIENLIELNPHRKVLIDSLTEQIDGEITTVNKHEYTIDFTPLVISPILESRQLFN